MHRSATQMEAPVSLTRSSGRPILDPDLNPAWVEFDVIKNANFNDKRAAIFHYCIFGSQTAAARRAAFPAALKGPISS